SVGGHGGGCRRGAGGGACGGGVPGAHQDLRGGQGGHARGARRVGGGGDQGGDHRRDRGDRGRGGGGARRRRGRGRGICVTGAAAEGSRRGGCRLAWSREAGCLRGSVGSQGGKIAHHLQAEVNLLSDCYLSAGKGALNSAIAILAAT